MNLTELSFPTLCFYLCAAITVAAALGVITAKNPVHAVLSLVLAFFSSGMIWLLLQAEFLAISIVLIYIGVVMVLFLFVVMMVDINAARLRDGFWRYLPVGLVVAGVMVAEMALVLNGRYFGLAAVPAPEPAAADFSNVKMLAHLLYTEYAYAFELAALILTVGLIAAVMLTFNKRVGSKRVDPADQVAVKARDRLVMHSIPAEKEPVVEPVTDGSAEVRS
ncbi:MAG: NADH:ubiquinone oxidoreductase subunit J [Candidatus Dactylopiibacterium carminicum]|uniref:NADH-quinone oxidoreductase subunit J n=1 Tax=Candidatus Dactylopiibacterium carminicum TaxID=857335 RepID=A0A272EPZ9_9RHOO|nr:NADH-quinone oxidoreductase subunit J [Candidatus Dactylopiibacterium carminicum]KAF7598420.1 NADH:ubiquinone oxidoreductase subunit J [Candidatus Dactylopiibacterium carminicum]PAS92187.1 MAG: NADH:ubiquinone oxidoreductase subunit J [Candidatus Dactylopiibacterium carminicum]PAS95662.1 MAG: NADH:ubiquinone oxidoreductase subunit J [Candidatus Dactylopiibacterium carminicum]PAS97654.1 MAG: NADH:ubiquinone oxidoreductase subunit J [Candidatus Dactylopiibacterium carminicum]